jgi:hypothetical protein
MTPVRVSKNKQIHRKTIDRISPYENKSVNESDEEWREIKGGRSHTFRHFQDLLREVKKDSRSQRPETCKWLPSL